MKPYGRIRNLKGTGPWKRDCHPPRGYINWWEDMIGPLDRGAIKQAVSREIQQQLSEVYE